MVESCIECPFASDNGRYGDHARCAALPEGKDDICLAYWAKFRRHDCPLRHEDIPGNRTESGIKECSYIADFAYIQDGAYVVEDTKGVRTEAYKIKRKLMLERYGIQIKEV